MITGDAKETAAAVSETLGICQVRHPGEQSLVTSQSSAGYTEELLLSGAQVDQMSDDALAQVADRVFAYYRATPLHKLRIVKALQVKFVEYYSNKLNNTMDCKLWGLYGL